MYKTILSILALLPLLIVNGCTDGDEFFVNPRTDRPGSVSATQVDEVNFAPDELAHTPATVSIDKTLIVQADQPGSLLGQRVLSASDATAMLFQGGNRIFATHKDSNGTTRAVELIAPDRDFSVPVDFDAAVLVPVRLDSYLDSQGQFLNEVNRRANYWLAIYSYQTLRSSSNGQVGPRRAIAYHVFRPDVKTQTRFDDPDFGILENGWQITGRTLTLPNTSANANITGFAAISDGLIGTAHFTSSASAHSATDTQPVSGAPTAASYKFGQAMTRFGLLVFQELPDDAATMTADARMATYYSSLNIGTLTFETGLEITVPQGHFEANNTGDFVGATAYDPGQVLVSNQHALVLLRDARRVGATTQIDTTEIVGTIISVIDQQDGTSALRFQADTDLSLNGATRGFHGSGIGERATIQPSLVALGPDEGIDGETLFFLLVNDNANTTADPDTDNQLYVAAVNSRSGTTFEGELLNRPRRLSAHLDTTTTAVVDPVFDVSMKLTRDGTAALLTYRQLEQTGSAQGIGLNTVLIKLDPGSGFPGSRFTPEIRVDQPQSDSNRFPGGQQFADVSQFKLQDGLVQRVGNQITGNLAVLLYEQSGATQDRVFATVLDLDTTGIPGITLRSELELETLFPVVDDNGLRTRAFVDQTVDLTQFSIVDIGTDILKNHQWFIAFAKEVDDETIVDDRGDIDILGQFLLLDENQQTALGNRLRLDDTDEVAGLNRSRRTQLVSAYCPISASIETTIPTPGFMTIVFQQPNGNNASSGLGLYVRTMDLNRYRGDPTNGVRELFNPKLNEASQQLDNGLGDVQVLNFQSSDQLGLSDIHANRPAIFREQELRSMIIFRQDGHLFASETQDGLNYSADNGRPDPQIVDNESFGTTIDSVQQAHLSPFQSQNGTHANGSTIMYRKTTSQSQALRVLIRTIRAPALF